MSACTFDILARPDVEQRYAPASDRPVGLGLRLSGENTEQQKPSRPDGSGEQYTSVIVHYVGQRLWS